MTFDRCPLRRACSWSSSQQSRSISFLKCHSVLAQASPSVDTNFWRSWSSRKISSRWSPRFMTWYIAPGYSMRSLRDMGNPYQHVPEVSIVRTDTCMARPYFNCDPANPRLTRLWPRLWLLFLLGRFFAQRAGGFVFAGRGGDDLPTFGL